MTFDLKLQFLRFFVAHLTDAVSSSRYTQSGGWMMVHNESERNVKLLFCHLPAETVDNHEKPQSGIEADISQADREIRSLTV
jgi:hypothetical protein